MSAGDTGWVLIAPHHIVSAVEALYLAARKKQLDRLAPAIERMGLDSEIIGGLNGELPSGFSLGLSIRDGDVSGVSNLDHIEAAVRAGSIDYLNGVPLKITLREGEPTCVLAFDRDHGEGAAVRALREAYVSFSQVDAPPEGTRWNRKTLRWVPA